MKRQTPPAITAVSGALAALQEKLDREPHAHVFVTYTTNRRVPLSKLGAESRRLRRAIKAGGFTIRSIEFGTLSRKGRK